MLQRTNDANPPAEQLYQCSTVLVASMFQWHSVTDECVMRVKREVVIWTRPESKRDASPPVAHSPWSFSFPSTLPEYSFWEFRIVDEFLTTYWEYVVRHGQLVPLEQGQEMDAETFDPERMMVRRVYPGEMVWPKPVGEGNPSGRMMKEIAELSRHSSGGDK